MKTVLLIVTLTVVFSNEWGVCTSFRVTGEANDHEEYEIDEMEDLLGRSRWCRRRDGICRTEVTLPICPSGTISSPTGRPYCMGRNRRCCYPEEHESSTTTSPPPESSTTTFPPPGCGGEYDSNTGTIRHPSDGGDYQNNENCGWVIRAEEPITISFTSFSTESCCDHVYVYDGESADGTEIGEFSGTSIPSPITVSNTAYIQFTSDHSIVSTGFEIEWEPSVSGDCTDLGGTPITFDGKSYCLRNDVCTSWNDTEQWCVDMGMAIAQPSDSIALATYIHELGYGCWYWLGATGDGSNQVWLSGAVIPNTDSLYRNPPPNTNTDYCLAMDTCGDLDKPWLTYRCESSCGYRLCEEPIVARAELDGDYPDYNLVTTEPEKDGKTY